MRIGHVWLNRKHMRPSLLRILSSLRFVRGGLDGRRNASSGARGVHAARTSSAMLCSFMLRFQLTWQMLVSLCPCSAMVKHLLSDPPPVLRRLPLQALPSLLLSRVVRIGILKQLLDALQDLRTHPRLRPFSCRR